MYKLLWQDKGKIPMYWDMGIDNLLEGFILEKKRDVSRILNSILWLNNNSTYIPGRILLTWFYPKLESLFNSIDSRDMVFAMNALFIENYLPKHVLRRIKRWEEDDEIKSVQVYISDTDFQEWEDWV